MACPRRFALEVALQIVERDVATRADNLESSAASAVLRRSPLCRTVRSVAGGTPAASRSALRAPSARWGRLLEDSNTLRPERIRGRRGNPSRCRGMRRRAGRGAHRQNPCRPIPPRRYPGAVARSPNAPPATRRQDRGIEKRCEHTVRRGLHRDRAFDGEAGGRPLASDRAGMASERHGRSRRSPPFAPQSARRVRPRLSPRETRAIRRSRRSAACRASYS